MSTPTASALSAAVSRVDRRGGADSIARVPPLPDEVAEIASRSNARSRADWKRSSGLFSRGRSGRASAARRAADRRAPRIGRQNRAHRVGGGGAGEGAAAAEHFVEDRAEAEDVGAVIGGEAAHLLRGHVADRAEDNARRGALLHGWRERQVARRRPQLGDAEVENLDAAVARDEQVLGLEIA